MPFAFAIAALATGRLGEGWLLETRRWTLFAWGFLTIGIVLGSWWSYEVLGWGGAWAWDPVENASFLPWLTATAYIHSVMVQERRGMLRVWNLVAAVRDVLAHHPRHVPHEIRRTRLRARVHRVEHRRSGSCRSSRSSCSSSVGLIGWRGDRLRSPGRIDSPLSREAAFLYNNLFFAVFAFAVLLGTVWPLIVEAVNGEQLSVGRPWFDFFGMVLGLFLLALMAVAPVLPWRKTTIDTLAHRLQWPAWVGVGGDRASPCSSARAASPRSPRSGLGGFAAGSALRQVVLSTRRQGWRGFVGRANGGMIVHLGVVVLVVGYIASSTFQTSRRSGSRRARRSRSKDTRSST